MLQNLQLLVSLATSPDSFSVIVTPYLPLIGTIFGGLIIGIFAVYNRRKGNVETRAPEVNEIWAQQNVQSHQLDMERRLRRKVEDLLYALRKAFKAYVHRVQRGGPTELTPHEIEILQRDVDTSDIDVPKGKE